MDTKWRLGFLFGILQGIYFSSFVAGQAKLPIEKRLFRLNGTINYVENDRRNDWKYMFSEETGENFTLVLSLTQMSLVGKDTCLGTLFIPYARPTCRKILDCFIYVPTPSSCTYKYINQKITASNLGCRQSAWYFKQDVPQSFRIRDEKQGDKSFKMKYQFIACPVDEVADAPPAGSGGQVIPSPGGKADGTIEATNKSSINAPNGGKEKITETEEVRDNKIYIVVIVLLIILLIACLIIIICQRKRHLKGGGRNDVDNQFHYITVERARHINLSRPASRDELSGSHLHGEAIDQSDDSGLHFVGTGDYAEIESREEILPAERDEERNEPDSIEELLQYIQEIPSDGNSSDPRGKSSCVYAVVNKNRKLSHDEVAL